MKNSSRLKTIISALAFVLVILAFTIVVGRVLPHVQIIADGHSYLNKYSSYIGAFGLAALLMGGCAGMGVGARIIVMTVMRREYEKSELVGLALMPFLFSTGLIFSYFYVVAYVRSGATL